MIHISHSQRVIWRYVFTVLIVLSCFATGTYVIYLYLPQPEQINRSNTDLRVRIALIYVLLISFVLTVGEIGFLAHPDFMRGVRLLLRYLGKAVILCFMGGLVLDCGTGGWTVGIFTLVVALLTAVVPLLLGLEKAN